MLELPHNTQSTLAATPVDSEEAARLLTDETETSAVSMPAPPQEEDTKEAAYARMQALLAERNGLPPPQLLPVPASISQQPWAGASANRALDCGQTVPGSRHAVMQTPS